VTFTREALADGRRLLEDLLDRIARAGLIDGCTRQHPQAGRLRLSLFGSGTPLLEGVPADEVPVHVTVQGELAETPLAHCLHHSIEAAIAETDLPPRIGTGRAIRWLALGRRGDWRWQAE
jgi:hypothetical protein